MSDLTLIVIFMASFAGGYIVGHVHALMSYHRRK